MKIFGKSRCESQMEKEVIIQSLLQRNQQLENIAILVTHQLRGPVANLKGLTYILNEYPQSDHTMEILHRIRQSAEILDQEVMSINRILDQD